MKNQCAQGKRDTTNRNKDRQTDRQTDKEKKTTKDKQDIRLSVLQVGAHTIA